MLAGRAGRGKLLAAHLSSRLLLPRLCLQQVPGLVCWLLVSVSVHMQTLADRAGASACLFVFGSRQRGPEGYVTQRHCKWVLDYADLAWCVLAYYFKPGLHACRISLHSNSSARAE